MEYKMKTVDELEFSDDFMFCAVMKDVEICKDDPFNANIPIYTFLKCLSAKKRIIFKEKNKLFYNPSRFNDVKEPKLNSFLKYVYSNTPADDFTASLERTISQMKINEIFKSTYMIMSLHEQTVLLHGKEEGIKEGIKEGIIKTEVKLLENNVPLVTIKI